MSVATHRWFLPAVFLGWGAFAAWCVWGFPPPVDLAAHGAQLQTLANLLRGDPQVGEVFEIHLPLGYGLPYWLFLPVALVSNGAVAVRLALWVSLQLFPIALLALLRVYRRPDWMLLLGLPLAFNFSYWYGLLPGLFAQPVAILTLAAFQKSLEQPRLKWIALVNLGAVVTLQCHLVAFVALLVALGALALSASRPARSLRHALMGLALPLVLSIPKVWSMAHRAIDAGPWPATEYNALSHLNWFFRNYRPEGLLAAAGPILVSGILFIAYLRQRRQEPVGPAAMFVAMLLLYLATPKTLSGIFLISVRLPIFAAMLSLVLVGDQGLKRSLRVGLVLVSLASLAETAIFHWRFARAVDGLEQMMAGPPPGRHGYLPLKRFVLGSRQIYTEHLGQWLTATRGGVGHNFFADAEHHPVRFKPGQEIPADLTEATPEQLARFDRILVFGSGSLPTFLAQLRKVAHQKLWRRLDRPRLR